MNTIAKIIDYCNYWSLYFVDHWFYPPISAEDVEEFFRDMELYFNVKE